MVHRKRGDRLADGRQRSRVAGRVQAHEGWSMWRPADCERRRRNRPWLSIKFGESAGATVPWPFLVRPLAVPGSEHAAATTDFATRPGAQGSETAARCPVRAARGGAARPSWKSGADYPLEGPARPTITSIPLRRASLVQASKCARLAVRISPPMPAAETTIRTSAR